MAWKKASVELGALLEEALTPFVCENRKMFGCPAYFVGDTWFAGVHEDNMVVRLSTQDRDAVQRDFPGAGPFIPMGRPMKEFVVLPESLYRDTIAFRGWLRRAYEYSQSMPAKEPKSKRQTKGA